MRKSLGILLACVLLFAFSVPLIPTSAISADKVIKWDFNLWGGPRAWTLPIERWAKDMEAKTNGKWQIKIHYGGVLAPAKEVLDGIKAGMFQASGLCCAYTPGKTPLHRVSELPFIAPEKTLHIIQLVVELWKHPAMKKELLKWNAVPFMPAAIPQYHLMGNKPIRTVEDFNGLRVRIGGDIGKVLAEFGAVRTTPPAAEVYDTISRGTVDVVGFPYTYAFGSYKVYEVSKYLNIPLTLGTMNCPFIANKDTWDALPEEFKKLHMEWYNRAPEEWAAEYKKADDKWIPIFKEKLEWIDFPSSERDKLVAKAEAVYEEWVKELEKKGLPAREILNYYIQKRKEIAGK